MNATMLVRTLCATACLALAGFPAAATAQFFYNASITSIDPATCTTTGATAPAVGTFAYFLPDAPDNVIITVSVNGGPTTTQLQTILPPSAGPGPIALIIINPPAATPLPWTVVIEEFPAINGQRVGSGVRGIAVCPAVGPGTITVVNVPAVAAAVPALPEYGAAVLSVLIALAFALHLRRSRRPAPRRRD